MAATTGSGKSQPPSTPIGAAASSDHHLRADGSPSVMSGAHLRIGAQARVYGVAWTARQSSATMYSKCFKLCLGGRILTMCSLCCKRNMNMLSIFNIYLTFLSTVLFLQEMLSTFNMYFLSHVLFSHLIRARSVADRGHVWVAARREHQMPRRRPRDDAPSAVVPRAGAAAAVFLRSGQTCIACDVNPFPLLPVAILSNTILICASHSGFALIIV